MKKIVLLYLLLSVASKVYAQDLDEPLDASSIMGIPRATNLAELNAITGPDPTIGSIAYNNADNKIYVYINDTERWVTADLDEQDASEVPLVVNTNVDGTSTDLADLETNVEQAIQAITPITSKNGRVFYPPSIQISTDEAPVPFTRTLNLHQAYTDQYTGAGITRSTIGGTPAPNIPTYAVDELFYYVTFADPTVFSNISIDGNTGIMTYTIIGQPVDFNSLINVVFVVK